MTNWRAFARPLVVVALLLASPLPARAQEAPVPAYTGYVTDIAGVIDEARQAQLEAFLDQLQKKTGVQFAVLTVQSTAPDEPSVYKTRVFKAWGIGNAERDDGLLLLVAIQERDFRFETGYGLEGTLPDGWQSRMFRDLVQPRFRAGEMEEGITVAVLACAKRIGAEKGVVLEWNGQELRYDDSASRDFPSWLIPLVMFLIFFVVLPALRMNRYLRRGRRGSDFSGWGGGGYGGGGFGGFGGGFGGGGGGSSFGGFGGGSSGGGGGGGKW